MLLCSLGGCRGKDSSVPSGADATVAATVNGEPISLSDFDEHTDLKQTAQVLTPQGPEQTHVVGNFGLQSMQELVDQKVLLQMAKEKGLTPTEADIDAEIKLQTDIRPDYVALLERQGWTTKRIRKELEIGIARERLMTKGIEVPSKEVDDYIAKNPEQFSDPAQATLYFVRASTPAKKAAVDKEIAAGKDFPSIAAALSEDPNARVTSGLFAIKSVPQMPKRVQEILRDTPEKKTSAWIKDQSSFVKFFVYGKAASKKRPATASQKELLKRALAVKKAEASGEFTRAFYERLKSAKVDVAVPHLKEQWQKTWDQMSHPGTPSK